MTRTLVDGTIIVDPPDAPLAAFLMREGALAVGARRALPARVGPLLAEVETGAANARAAAGCVTASATASPGGPDAPPLAPSPEMTIQEVAQVIQRSPQRVRQLVADGTLTARRAGRRTLLVDADEVAGYILSRQEAA
jgi:excisionase family DNA binding protein